MKHQEQPKPAKNSIQKKPASKKPAKATMGEIQAMLGPRFDQEPDYEEPFAGHLAIHCTAPNCPSWLWIHRLYARTACQACGKPWWSSFLESGCKFQRR